MSWNDWGRAALAAIIAASVWGAYSLFRQSEYALFPVGDAAFYTSMTAEIRGDYRPEVPLSSMHSKRILVPLIASFMVPQHHGAFNFPYRPSEFPISEWSPEQKTYYSQVHGAWALISFLAFVGFAGLLILAIPSEWGAPVAWLVWLNIVLTPAFGLLGVLWPIMSDTVNLCFLTLALLLFRKNKDPLAWSAIGIAALAREQALMIIPIIFIARRTKLSPYLALAFIPYALVSLFPPFTNIVPLWDGASNVAVPSTSQWVTYLELFKYHWGVFLGQNGLVVPFTIMLTAGMVALPALINGKLANTRLWLSLSFTLVFLADRHMALVALVALPAMVPAGPVDETQRNKIFRTLLGLALLKLGLLAGGNGAAWLQSEHWYQLFEPRNFRIGMQILWGLTLIGVLYAVKFRSPFSKTAVSEH